MEREMTNKIYEMIQDGVLYEQEVIDACLKYMEHEVIDACLKYLNEEQVKDMMEQEGWLKDEDEVTADFTPVEPYYRHEEGLGKVKVVGQVNFGNGVSVSIGSSPVDVIQIDEVKSTEP